MKHAISISDALSSDKLFASFFPGPSWNTWRAVLKGMFGEPMSAAELEIFHEVASREPPAHRVREGVFICGRSAGKDSIASLIAAYIAVSFDPKGRLRPGERATILCLAVDRDQAKIVFDYIKAYFENVPALAVMVKTIRPGAIELRNRVVIEVHANSYRSVRGRTFLACIFDEVAMWRDENSAVPDTEVHGAVSPGLARMKGSMMIMISTAYRRSGLLYERFKNFYSVDDPDTLVVKGSSLTFNPTLDAALIEKAVASDPPFFRAEYFSEWRDDIASYLSREIIDAAVVPGRFELPRVAGIRYIGFADAAGGGGTGSNNSTNDSYAAAVAHYDRASDHLVLDALREKRPPFSPAATCKEFAEFFRSYGITKITADNWAGGFPPEQFLKYGVTCEISDLTKSELYTELLPQLNSRRVELLDNKRLISQLAGLERKTGSGGNEHIDHANRGHDDLINAAAGALVLCAGQRQHHGPIAEVYMEMSRQRPGYMNSRLLTPLDRDHVRGTRIGLAQRKMKVFF